MDEQSRSITEEEIAEAARHDVLYRKERPPKLALVPRDWEKFDDPVPATSGYITAIRRLGDLHGRTVLDAGCGDGWLSVILAKRGAIVHGFDISAEAVATAIGRARANAVEEQCRFEPASFYALPFDSERYDLVIGMAILHHVSHKDEVARELFRVMKPGARAVFCEPFGDSRMLERLRLLVPVKSQAEEDPDEWKRQFKYRDLEPFRARFDVRVEELQFFSRLDRIYAAPRFVDALGRLDAWLLRRVPALRRYAREVVVELAKPA